MRRREVLRVMALIKMANVIRENLDEAEAEQFLALAQKLRENLAAKYDAENPEDGFGYEEDEDDFGLGVNFDPERAKKAFFLMHARKEDLTPEQLAIKMAIFARLRERFDIDVDPESIEFGAEFDLEKAKRFFFIRALIMRRLRKLRRLAIARNMMNDGYDDDYYDDDYSYDYDDDYGYDYDYGYGYDYDDDDDYEIDPEVARRIMMRIMARRRIRRGLRRRAARRMARRAYMRNNFDFDDYYDEY